MPPGRGVDDVELATMSWVWWFNEIRLHSAIGHMPRSSSRTTTTVTTPPGPPRFRENQPSTEPSAIQRGRPGVAGSSGGRRVGVAIAERPRDVDQGGVPLAGTVHRRGENSKNRPVGVSELGFADLALQDEDLVAKGEDLGGA